MLDQEQLADVALGDAELMRELLAGLLEDTVRLLEPLAQAVRRQDAAECARLAHYGKGACANLGAQRAAALLQRLESSARAGDLAPCAALLGRLPEELDLLRQVSAPAAAV